VARHVGGLGGANPEAAAELPAVDPGDDEHLHAAPEHPGSYLSGQAEQQQQTLQQMAQQWMEQAQQQQQSFQQMTQEVLSTYTQLFNIPVSYAQEGLKTARFPIEGYDGLTVEEVSGRIGELSAEDLRVVRDHEERNKNRETVLEQLDRRIRSGT